MMREVPVSVPVKVAVVYHSHGHTVEVAEAVAPGAASVEGALIELIEASSIRREMLGQQSRRRLH